MLRIVLTKLLLLGDDGHKQRGKEDTYNYGHIDSDVRPFQGSCYRLLIAILGSIFLLATLVPSVVSTHSPGPRRPVVFVSVAAHVPASGAFPPHLVRTLSEFIFKYECCDVHIRVDTNSINVEQGLARAFGSSMPAGRHLTVNVIPLSEMDRDPLKLTWVHRQYMHLIVPLPDYYLYCEDDILVPYSSFSLYLERQQQLWERGLLFQFTRIERNSMGAVVAPDYDRQVPVSSIYSDNDGVLYTFAMPYAGFWVLTREQFRSFVADPACVYSTGVTKLFRTRERMAIGFNFAGGPGRWIHPADDVQFGNWVQRSLAPLTRNADSGALQVHARSTVWHLSNKYSKNALYSGKAGSLPITEVLSWPEEILSPVPLPDMRHYLDVDSTSGGNSVRLTMHPNCSTG